MAASPTSLIPQLPAEVVLNLKASALVWAADCAPCPVRVYGGCSSKVEHRTVAPDVAGSSPVIHPTQVLLSNRLPAEADRRLRPVSLPHPNRTGGFGRTERAGAPP